MIKRIALLTLLVAPLWLSAQVRTEKLLEKGWKFTREDNPEFKISQFDDTKWQSVCIPHDWAIYGPFSINNDKQNTAIVQDGQKEAMEHAGRTGRNRLVQASIRCPRIYRRKKMYIGIRWSHEPCPCLHQRKRSRLLA